MQAAQKDGIVTKYSQKKLILYIWRIIKLKKVITLVLCAMLLLSLFAGCDSPGLNEIIDTYSSPSAAVSADVSADPSVAPSEKIIYHDFQAAYETYAPDTVMLTVNGDTVCWDELYYWLYTAVTSLEENDGTAIDWGKMYTDDKTYEEYCLEYATNAAALYKCINQNAERLHITVTAENKQAIQDAWDSAVEEAGSEEAYIQSLQEEFISIELLNYFRNTNYLYGNCFIEMFGENGEKLSDEDAAEFVADDGYMMAKQILIGHENAKMDNGTPINARTEEEAKKLAEELLEKLNQCEPDKLEETFDELMNTYSDDTGKISYPDGYLFQETDSFIPAFINTTKELKIMEYSEIVESSYGYHIILRMPINFDVMPQAYAYYAYLGYNYTLRYIAASGIYDATLNDWMEGAERVTEQVYDELNLPELFAVG